MAKHQLTTKRLQTDSGKSSGLYLFCDGMMLFASMSKDAVLKLAKAGLTRGANNMSSAFEAIAERVAEPDTKVDP